MSQPAKNAEADPVAAAAERRLLLVAPTDYDSSVAKGVSALLFDFDEQGYFAKVVMAFPFTHGNRVVDLAPNLVIHEYGMGGSSLFRQVMGPLHILRVVRAVARLARDEDVAIVRATDPCLSGFVALLAARLARKPLCVSIHADFDKRHELDAAGGAPRVFGSRRLAIAIERLVLARADLVLPIRESLVDYARRRGARPDRIRVIPHGADLSAFAAPADPRALAALDLPRGRRLVSFAGRLSRENYLDDVLAAARSLGRSHGDVLVAIAGSGSESQRLADAVAADEGLRRSVRLLGSLPREAVAALRQASQVALCPMGGFSLIEACAAGVPAVAYDVEWHSELVIDGETGYLVPERDAEGLARAVARLLDHPEAGSKMGQAARKLALGRHDLAASVETKRRCYQELIDARGEAQA